MKVATIIKKIAMTGKMMKESGNISGEGVSDAEVS